MRDAKQMTIGGMNVVTSGDAEIGRTAAVRARLGLALELIDETTPRLGARMRHDLNAIYLARNGGIGYNPYVRVINLDVRSGMQGEVEDLALCLVHEATHARQAAMGVAKKPNGKLEARMEAHAVAESIAFANRLPPGTWHRPTVADLDTKWWTWENRSTRITEAMREANLPGLGVVMWIIRTLRMLRLVR